MKYALNIAADRRILSATYERFASDTAVLVDTLPEGNITDYLYINNDYVYSPLPVEEGPEPQPTTEERVIELEEALALLLEGATE